MRQGAELLLDGRGISVPGYESGNFMGPTLLSRVRTHMKCYTEEIFGPVLVCLEVRSSFMPLQQIERWRIQWSLLLLSMGCWSMGLAVKCLAARRRYMPSKSQFCAGGDAGRGHRHHQWKRARQRDRAVHTLWPRRSQVPE